MHLFLKDSLVGTLERRELGCWVTGHVTDGVLRHGLCMKEKCFYAKPRRGWGYVFATFSRLPQKGAAHSNETYKYVPL